MSVTVAKDHLTAEMSLTVTPTELVIPLPANLDPALAIHELRMRAPADWLIRCGNDAAPLFPMGAEAVLFLPTNRPGDDLHIWVRSATGTTTLSILALLY